MCPERPQKGATGQDAVSSFSPATPPAGKVSAGNWQDQPVQPGFEAGAATQ